MRNYRLLTGVATVSLLAGMSAALAEPVNLTIDDVNQTTTNNANVTNNGDIDHGYNAISGNGASLSVSAAGAVSSLSVSSINSPEFDKIDVGTFNDIEIIQQETTNNGNIRNNHNNNELIGSGTVSGDGASVSVSATGGASAVSLSSINNQGGTWGAEVDYGGIQQTTTNSGTITNNGGRIETGNITGDGASASIGASGAVSSVSVSSIVDGHQLNDVAYNADINQTTTNYGGGTIQNTGTVQVGNLAGQGVSASVSAIGAASAVSFSTISPIN
jgi:hypothetical protein